MLCQYGPGGALALCVNKPSNHTLGDLSEELDLKLSKDIPIYWGGPVSSRTIWMLHSSDWEIPGQTIEINDDWAMTSNTDMFHLLNEGHRPNRFRFMHGYAAWAPGQLDAEVEGIKPWRHQHSWLMATQPDSEWLFDIEESDLWTAATSLSASQAIAQWM